MTLAQKVRDGRYAKGWGPDELASRAAISRTALYQIESGKTEQPRAGTLRRIAQALEIPTETLLGVHLGVIAGPTASQGTWASAQGSPTDAQRVAGDDTHAHRFRLDDASPDRETDLDRKFRELLASPLGEGVARIVEESHRILPRSFAQTSW